MQHSDHFLSLLDTPSIPTLTQALLHPNIFQFTPFITHLNTLPDSPDRQHCLTLLHLFAYA